MVWMEFNKKVKQTFFSVYYCLPSPSVIMCNATHHTRAWQTLIYRKECHIVIVIYIPFKHKQFQKILFNCMQKFHLAS